MRPHARLAPLVAACTAMAAVAVPIAPSPSQADLAASGPCRSGAVSLTFDDGPSSRVTPQLVRILQRLDVPATFFMVGQRVDGAPDVARRVARAGFLVANHSYAHQAMTGQSSAEVVETLRATDRALRRAGVRSTRLMRPPYGAIDARVREAVRDAGFTPVLWDVDPRDWEGGSAEAIASSILAQLRPHRSNVVLQHDGIRNSPASVAAVPRVVREARRRGYCFVALDEQGRPGFPTPTITLQPPARRVREGQAIQLRLTLDSPTPRDTSVSVRLVRRSGGPATTTPVTIAAGRTSVAVDVPTRGDRLDETSERLDLSLVDPIGLALGVHRRSVLLVDDDPPPRVVGVDRGVVEPASGSTMAPVRFRLDRASGRDVALVVRTVAGTAGPDDVVPLERRVVIPAGRTTFTVDVSVLADDVAELDESLTVVVTRANGARIGRAATLTIHPPPAPGP